MRVVVDCGAIYECVRSGQTDLLRDHYTTPLVFFELGNVIWKNSILIKTYSQKEAFELLAGCELVLEKMYVSHSNLDDIYKVATINHLSFYDAGYVCLAKKLNLPFVTLDMRLQRKIHSFVQICPFESFIQRS